VVGKNSNLEHFRRFCAMENKPQLIKATSAFNRKTLRKTVLALFDNDIFQATTKILDRDTLQVITVVDHYTEPTLQALIGMYLKEFADIDSMGFDDWVPKSKVTHKQ
jgi:hypothetical protein